VSQGAIVCTGRGTHRRRTLATYAAEDGTSVVLSKQPGGTPMAQYPGVEHLRFRCPSCSRDLRFASGVMHRFLTADLPHSYRDVSALGATI